jgi:predicted HTH domain antitoxin
VDVLMIQKALEESRMQVLAVKNHKLVHRRCQKEFGGAKMTKTMSIRMDQENYEFLTEITKQERSDFSKAVRDLVTRGRVLLAVEKCKNGDASLGKAAQVAGLSVGQMMTLLAEFGVESRIEDEDYRQGLKNLAKVW